MKHFDHLVGETLGAGSHRVSPHVAWLFADAVGSEPHAARAHPGLAWVGAVTGSGVSLERILEVFEVDLDAGPVLGSTSLGFAKELVVGATYDVDCRVAAVERKHGARLGVFDMVTCEYAFREAGEPDVVADVGITYLFPRPGPG